MLYAFDGTWNDNKKGNDRDTSVAGQAGVVVAASDMPWYDFIKQPYRTVRWNDDIHASVTFDKDHDYNNPPAGADLVDDGPTGNKFKRA